MKHIGAVRKGGFHLGSIYLYHTIGARAKQNLDLLETVACTLAGLKGPWCIGGDFNCTPAQLIDTGWLKKVGGVVHYPIDATTDKGKTYDFFVTSISMSPIVETVRIIGDHRCTPHYAVRLTLKGNCRKVMVRLLKAPKNFSAILPHGPANRAKEEPFYNGVDDPNIGIDELGVMMYDSLERNLAEVAGLDEVDAEAHSGRSRGPKFGWKDLCGTPASVKCRSTDV